MANKNLFNSIKITKPKKNRFDLSHDVKMSLEFGKLYPTLAMECVPGDKFNIGCESLLRFAPLVAPVMHRMNVTMHYFFVPNRILWPNWEKWIVGEGTHSFPTLTQFSEGYQTLADYLGLPQQPDYTTPGTEAEIVNALPFAAYQAVYNEYYRDQNLIAEIDYKLTDGSNDAKSHLRDIRTRAWKHDYFTAALPFAQKGAPVSIPLGEALVVPTNEPGEVSTSGGWRRSTNSDIYPTAGAVNAAPGQTTIGSPGTDPVFYDPQGSLKVDSSSGSNINDLRRAFRLQEWLEKNARAGTRYVENILAHFGVKSSDARLQRPEYITGTKSPVVISEVLNTTGEEAGLPQGNMAGHGVSVTQGKYGHYFCEEHGYIIGIMSVLPEPAYQQGIPKHFLKHRDYLQYYWPEFAHIGEQEVENRELFAYTANGDDVFGYVPRYSEYKYMPSRVAGDFRTTLDFWHMGRKFDDAPALNANFIECNPDKRIFAVTDGETNSLYAHVYHKIDAIRPMPKFGTPMF